MRVLYISIGLVAVAASLVSAGPCNQYGTRSSSSTLIASATTPSSTASTSAASDTSSTLASSLTTLSSAETTPASTSSAITFSTTTSSAALTSFTITISGSTNSNANGKPISVFTPGIYSVQASPDSSNYVTGMFTWESSTGYLAVNGQYLARDPYNDLLYTGSSAGIAVDNLLYVICSEPSAGKALSCYLDGYPTYTQFYVSSTASSEIYVEMGAPNTSPSTGNEGAAEAVSLIA